MSSCDFCIAVDTEVTKCPCCNKLSCFECDAMCDYCNTNVCEEDIKKCPTCKRKNPKYVCTRCIDKEFKKCHQCKKSVCGACVFKIQQNDEVLYICNTCVKVDILGGNPIQKIPDDLVLGFCVKCKTIRDKKILLDCDKCGRLACEPTSDEGVQCFSECDFCQEVACDVCASFITKCRSQQHPSDTLVSCGQCSVSCSRCLNSFCPRCIKKCPKCNIAYCVECEPSFHCGLCISCVAFSSQTSLIDY